LAAEDEFGGTMAVGQEAVIADVLEARWQGVLQEAADELLGGDGHHLGFAAVAVIFPLEGDLAVFQDEQAAVGNGDAVSVAAEIFEHVLGSTERCLGVDHPFGISQRSQVAGECWWIAEGFQVTEAPEFSGGISLLQGIQEHTAEEPAQHLDGQQVLTLG